MPGPEPWIRVEHRGGWFKLPLFTSIEELVLGVQQGWTKTPSRRLREEATVRVPLSQVKSWPR
jgi:hypothetical protein